MAREISLAAGERGVVRVFALSLAEAEAEALREAGGAHLFGGVEVVVARFHYVDRNYLVANDSQLGKIFY